MAAVGGSVLSDHSDSIEEKKQKTKKEGERKEREKREREREGEKERESESERAMPCRVDRGVLMGQLGHNVWKLKVEGERERERARVTVIAKSGGGGAWPQGEGGTGTDLCGISVNPKASVLTSSLTIDIASSFALLQHSGWGACARACHGRCGCRIPM